jgi:hypothetical protein
MSTWNWKLKSMYQFPKISKNHSQFGYETFVKDKYLDDFGNFKIFF